MKAKITIITMIAVMVFGGVWFSKESGEGTQWVTDPVDGYITYEAERSILRVQAEYLGGQDILTLSENIEEAIEQLEEDLGRSYDVDHYEDDKIEVYVNSGRGVSHVEGGYDHPNVTTPRMYLYYASVQHAPYVHELTHIIARDYNTLWLREGLAIVMNDRLDGDSAFPNFGKDKHALAAEFINDGMIDGQTMKVGADRVLTLIKHNGVPYFNGKPERYGYYILSGSLVQYLIDEMGLETFMTLYDGEDPDVDIEEITGQSMEAWKASWMEAIGANEPGGLPAD